MNKLLFLSIALSGVSHAEILKDKVHSVENTLVKFASGRVAYMDTEVHTLSPGDRVRVNLDERSSILSLRNFGQENTPEDMAIEEVTPPPKFQPTLVKGMGEAVKIFNRSNPNYRRISECTDRAHVWAHDELKASGTTSEKAFVFFTSSYINEVRFKWWFHVAPLYTVSDGGTKKKLVMDYRYTDRPMTIKEWTDRFVHTKRACKVTEKFSEYDNNPQTENCYLITRSMHYRLPLDIEWEETHGQYKTETSESELRMSFNYAFQK